MASIRRGTIVRDIIDSLKLQVGNVLPDQTSDKLVLTYDFGNVRQSRVLGSATGTATGTIAIFTTDANRDTYVTGVQLSFVKNATCDYASGNITMQSTTFLDGSQHIARLSTLTLTAERGEIFVKFNKPLRVQRNTAISISSSVSTAFSAGALVRSGVIFGYVEDN